MNNVKNIMLSLGVLSLAMGCGSDSNDKAKSLQVDVGSAKYKILSQPGVTVSELESVYIEESNLTGMGFSITQPDGKKFLIFQKSTDPDNSTTEIQGSDIGNILKLAQAVEKHAGNIQIFASTPEKAYHETLEALGAANVRFTPAQQQDLAEDMKAQKVDAGESPDDVELVFKKDLKIETSDVSFSCANVASVSEITQTTGGSVNIFQIDMTEGEDLHVNTVVGRPYAMENLEVIRDLVINRCARDPKLEINVGWHIYQDPIFTNLGTYAGTITNPDNLVLRDAEGTAIIAE